MTAHGHAYLNSSDLPASRKLTGTRGVTCKRYMCTRCKKRLASLTNPECFDPDSEPNQFRRANYCLTHIQRSRCVMTGVFYNTPFAPRILLLLSERRSLRNTAFGGLSSICCQNGCQGQALPWSLCTRPFLVRHSPSLLNKPDLYLR